jgi:hypothetical protein
MESISEVKFGNLKSTDTSSPKVLEKKDGRR